MTEVEWLAAADPAPMTEFIRAKASERKLYLLAAECFYFFDESGNHWAHAAAIEQAADSTRPRLAMLKAIERFPGLQAFSQGPFTVARELCIREINAYSAVFDFGWAMQELFGNPFRSVAFDPAWRTSTVLALTEGIYADHAFDHLPILADALQDVGCDSDDILTHCRGEGPHVRGCWVVDLVLGKS